MNPAQILIVEDELVLAQALRITLENMGYCIPAILSSGEAVLEQIQNAPPDLILMDIVLQGELDGVQTAEQIRLARSIPVIFITARSDADTIKRAISTAPFGYILKPFQTRELQLTIELALQNRQMERSIREREELYRSLTELSPNAILLLDPNGMIVLSNPMAVSLYGASGTTDLIGNSFFELFITQDQIRIRDAFVLELFNKGVLSPIVSTAMRFDGSLFPVEVSASLVSDEKGNPTKIIAVIQDITEREASEKAILREAFRAKMLAGVASQINRTLDFKQMLNTVCRNVVSALNVPGVAVTLFEDDEDQVISVASLGPHGDLTETMPIPIPVSLFKDLWKAQGKVIQIPNLGTFEGALPLSHPLLQDVKSVVVAFMVQGEQLIGSINMITMEEAREFSEDELSLLSAIADLASIAITHARLFEQVVAGRARLQSLSRQLVEVQEAERRYLANELHDHIGQMLTGLQFSLEMGKVLSDQEVKSNLSSAQEVVQEIITQVREISLGLRPSLLDDMGLLVCLDWHFERYTKQTGIQVQFAQHGISERRFPTEIETTVFRIIQEALTNVARHTQVTEALVSIQADERNIFLTVQDHGQGFDSLAAEAEYNSVGLGGMRERANLVGGFLEIRSACGAGTTIEAHIPTQNRLERRKYGRNRAFSR